MYDNRTEPIFKDTTPTNSVNFGLTTLCTMSCPNCSLNMPGVKEEGVAKHATLSQILSASIHLRNLKRLHLTGGEPTMHPEFKFIVLHVHKWFNPKYLTIETNGTYYRKYKGLFSLFDKVFITHYVRDQIYPNNFDNTAIIEEAERDLGDRLIREPPVIHRRKHLTVLGLANLPCSKYFDPGLPSGWYDGLMYPCCVSFGIDRSLGFPLTKDWREKIVKKDMGCNRCLYQGT